MKKYEIEALLKNFFIFFFLQLLLLAIIYNKTLSSKIKSIDSNLLDRMKLCSYTLDCKEFRLGFIEKESQPVVTLIKEENELFSLFHIPDSKKYLLKLSLDKAEYLKKIEEVRGAIKKEFLIYALLIAILSFIFSLYSLYPFKKALDLNEKFIKDILHDYNTPISSLLINFKLLKKEIGENRKINRMEQSINTLLMLQNNLRYFLSSSRLQKEVVELEEVIKERIEYFKAQYGDLKFEVKDVRAKIEVNRDAFIRVIDNLLSNASKYNIPNGYINIYLKDKRLYIVNSSRGIKNPNKVFLRYYKESERGIGIGLDIVKKLCEEMGIDVKLKSKDKEVVVILDLSKVIVW